MPQVLPVQRSEDTAELRERLRSAARGFAAGVVLVTGQVGERPWGMTATAFCCVSLDPPTVLVCLGSATALAASAQSDGWFGISILSTAALELAERHARPGVSKFLPPKGDFSSSVSPVAEGALAHLDCEVQSCTPIGDHLMIVGRVREVVDGMSAPPLLYFDKAFRQLSDDALAPAAKFGSLTPGAS